MSFTNLKLKFRDIAIRLLHNRNFIIVVVLTLGLLPLLILEGAVHLYGDSYSQMLPFVYETKRMFASDLPFWSWDTYIGQDFLFSYAFYTTTNPFVWLNCLFPYEYLNAGFIITVYLKYLLCGFIADKYFRIMGLDKKLSLLGSLLYTFSSWAIVALYYYMFLDPMLLFPLLLMCIERLFKDCKFKYSCLTLVIFLVIWINYYFAPGSLIAASIYYFCRVLSFKLSNKQILTITLKVFLCAVLAILMSSILLYPVYLMLHNSPRNSIVLDVDLYSYLERFLSIFIPKICEGSSPFIIVTSKFNMNAAGIAVLGVFLAMIYALNRRGWLMWLLAIYTFSYLTPVNGLFLLFSSSEYTRWIYALVLAVILASLYFLSDFGCPKQKIVWLYIFVSGSIFLSIFCLTLISLIKNDLIHTHKFRLLIIVAILVFIALCSLYYIFIYHSPKIENVINRSLFCVILCVILQIQAHTLWAAEIGVFSEDRWVRNKYNDIHFQQYDHGNFRCRYAFDDGCFNQWGYNVGMVVGCPSDKTFHSVMSPKFCELSKLIDYNHKFIHFSPGNSRESYDALMSVKTLVTKEINKDNNMRIVPRDNSYYIPMGYGYDKYILKDSLLKRAKADDNFDVALAMLDAIVIDKDDAKILSEYIARTQVRNNLHLDSLILERGKVVCDSFDGDTHGFTAHIDIDSPKIIFFSIVNDPGMSAFINGIPTEIYDANLGMSAIIVPAGNHNIRFEYFPVGLKQGAIVSSLAIILFFIISFLESFVNNKM